MNRVNEQLSQEQKETMLAQQPVQGSNPLDEDFVRTPAQQPQPPKQSQPTQSQVDEISLGVQQGLAAMGN